MDTVNGNDGDKGTTAEVRNVEVADATVTTPALQNDTGIVGSVLGSNLMGQNVNVIGAATILSQYGPNLQSMTVSPLRQGQAGFFDGHVVGAIDNTQRSFSPTAVRFTNLATTSAAMWTFTGGKTQRSYRGSRRQTELPARLKRPLPARLRSPCIFTPPRTAQYLSVIISLAEFLFALNGEWLCWRQSNTDRYQRDGC